ncbi:MAG: FHA domain-containing protein [Candidatus Adiutrix sp.]|nr:FHA domain-containing protein [Candidatus Adiutrix sp.]
MSHGAGASRPSIVIGRGPEADFRLEAPGISKRHASLTPQGDGRFLLTDLGSTNGLFVGSPDKRVQSAVVGLNDAIYLAGHRLSVAEVIGRPAASAPAPAPRLSIGRTADNNIVLKDDSVSRRHAFLVYSGGVWHLEDVGSQNGTFVNSRKITNAAITDSDRLKFGRYEIGAGELTSRARARGGAVHPNHLSRAAQSLWPSARSDRVAIYIGLALLAIVVLGFTQLYQSVRHDSGAPGQLAPGPNVLDRSERATVFVVTKTSSGSGFFISPDLVLTNRHVVEGTWQCLVASKTLGQPVEAEVVARGAGKAQDFAVLRLGSPANISPLIFSTKAKRGDRVGAFGFPGLLLKIDPNAIPEVVYTSGEINVIYERPLVSIIAHTAVVSQGNSGGPLTDDKGRVVGVNTLIMGNEESYRQANIALSAKDIIAFLRANKLPYTVDE